MPAPGRDEVPALTAGVSPGDRLGFTLFLATLIHALLIFGLGFSSPLPHPAHVMEVTLALHRSDHSNPDADYLAQANQQGSGELDHAQVQESPEQSAFHEARIQETAQQDEQQNTRQQIDHRVTTRGHSRRVPKDTQQKQQDAHIGLQSMNSDAQSQEIATLEARLAAKRQAYAKRPRVRSVSSVSTRYDRDAAYVDAFRRKIEMVGNENYPPEARERHLHGSVRLLVAIDAGGHVKRIDVLKRSGSGILDAAAQRSVWLAQPFQVFPEAIRRDTDILQIIRTWKYDDQLQSTGE
ncbi:MAG: energy transducer TonB [Pseudomonadales bacterium]|nr:energy transducer TonB [Pseudomonadales bacterium]